MRKCSHRWQKTVRMPNGSTFPDYMVYWAHRFNTGTKILLKGEMNMGKKTNEKTDFHMSEREACAVAIYLLKSEIMKTTTERSTDRIWEKENA